jgi:tetraacyldisaccharide 4'-kinase
MREPSWWYDETRRLGRGRILVPVGFLYGALAARRMQQPASYRSTLPVICVGNFTAGGTGKTPFVKALVGVLRAAGHCPAILSRGYGGRIVGPHWVDLGVDTAADVGDEPLLHVRHAPVVVAKDRAAGARLIEGATTPHVQATVIVMDDGLQNPSLAKDLSIAVVDAARGFGNGRCVPAGPLRAPLLPQLTRTDALVINHGGGLSSQSTGVTLWAAGVGKPVLSARIKPAGDVAWLQGQTVVAFAGIGVPERFFDTLRAVGAVVKEAHRLPDHHVYRPADAAYLLALAASHKATLVTTEKDYARLTGQAGALQTLAEQSRVIPIEMSLDAASIGLLAALLAQHFTRRD